MNELIEKVKQWAEDRNLISGSDAKTQYLKLMSEFGELADSINKGKDCRDDIGDCLVVLTIIAAQQNVSLHECLEIAYEDIKNRTGVLFDGVFIKESDPQYPVACAVLGARRVHTEVPA